MKKLLLVVLVGLMFVFTLHAQQTLTIDDYATEVGHLRLQINVLRQYIGNLQKELKRLTDENKELKAKLPEQTEKK